MAVLLTGCAIAISLAAAGTFFVYNSTWAMRVVEWTTVYSVQRLGGTSLRQLESMKRISRWFVPSFFFIASACVAISTLRAAL